MPQILKAEVVTRLTKTWRACREQYPGWVIAPAEAREALWRHTEYWWDLIPAALSRMEAADALLLLHEAVWRVETSLVPLYLNQVGAITDVLERLNPAPSLLPWPNSPQVIESSKRAGSQVLFEAWVDLAFAVMREAREDFDVARFNEWQQRTERAATQRPHWFARWHYEKALFALWRFDFHSLERNLQAWPSQIEELPFWEAKRAALWAEFGEPQRAKTIAESALQGVRSRMPAGAMDYRLLSQEGWTLRLLMALEQRGSEQMRESDRVRFQDRFAALSRYECNPWEITEWLELALHAPRPRLQLAHRETHSFDPGTVTQHFSSTRHGPSEAARPAFAFLRVIEEAAFPLKVGSLTMLTEGAKNIPRWIAPFAFSWALATAIRGDEGKVIEKLFDRATVGALPKDQADSLSTWLAEVAESCIATLDPEKSNGWDRPLAERILPVVLNALSRLLLRVDEQEVARLLDLAEQVCRVKSLSTVFSSMKYVQSLFARAIDWRMSDNEILRRLPSWLNLPLPSEIGGPEQTQLSRAEPFRHVRTKRRKRWVRPKGFEVTRRIEELMSSIRDGSPVDRHRASMRLVVVAELGGLHRSEIRRLGEALWSKRSPITGLPSATDVRLPLLLRYCPLPEREWRGLVRHAFLELPIPRIREPNADGTSFTIDDKMSAIRRLGALCDITETAFTLTELRRYTIDWTPEEALALVGRAAEWWEAEKTSFAGNVSQFDAAWVLRPAAGSIVDMLTALAPRLRKTTSEQAVTSVRLLDSMAVVGIDTLEARPAMIAVGGDPNRTRLQILSGLLGTDPQQVRGAGAAIRNWTLSAQKRQIPSLPLDLHEAIVWKVVNRRGPALDSVIAILGNLLDLRAMKLSSQERELLVLSLGILLTETEIATDLESAMLSPDCEDGIPFDERPDHRWRAAQLAYSLERYLVRQRQPVPDVIAQWREASLVSSLPELRRVWKDTGGED